MSEAEHGRLMHADCAPGANFMAAGAAYAGPPFQERNAAPLRIGLCEGAYGACSYAPSTAYAQPAVDLRLHPQDLCRHAREALRQKVQEVRSRRDFEGCDVNCVARHFGRVVADHAF